MFLFHDDQKTNNKKYFVTVQWLAFLISVLEVPDSNLGAEVGLPDRFRCFPQFLQPHVYIFHIE